ncbi:MAG: hypothetical protein ACRERD_29325, partial [Candidatus Binatia bacterium]
HGDEAGRASALANLAGLYARAPGLHLMRAVLAGNADVLGSVLREFNRDIHSEKGVRVSADGVARLECYALSQTLDILRARGITVDVVADQTALNLTRRDVVVQGNSFADGSIFPGVGVRI